MAVERQTGGNNKIFSPEGIALIVAGEKSFGKTSGLVTGFFDIVHINHVDLFRFAKRRVYILIVGLETDKTARIAKGDSRPINNIRTRLDFLPELTSVDLVFELPFSTTEYKSSKKLDEQYIRLYKMIKPDYLITGTIADRYWKEKRNLAEILNIGYLGQEGKKETTSTSLIAEKIQNDL